jgi:sulfur carrier protein
MITIRFNETLVQLEDPSLAVLLKIKGYKDAFAVSVNRTFVPKAAHDTTQLQENDLVEIIQPMQGG